MSKSKHIFPVNRVEGDLDIRIEVEDGVVVDAWSIGTMFRGIENILKGRAVLDGLVITPRVCGICSSSHLKAAALALDVIFDANVPDNGRRVRNATLIVEQIQNDIRHPFLLFMPDFANVAYKEYPLYGEAVRRYEPLRGETAVQTIQESKRLIEIISILGGQWPHSSFMVPGGVVSVPDPDDVIQCRQLLRNFRVWFEKRIIGCTLDRFQDVKSESDLFSWLEECADHRESDLGFYVRFSKEAGLDRIGTGCGNYISFGSHELPEESSVKGINGSSYYLPAGFFSGRKTISFNQDKIAEDVSHSFYDDYGKSRHPFEGLTNPLWTGDKSEKYSWAKAPRYDGMPAETGPLAEMIISSNPLFKDLTGNKGPTVFVRELARLVRPVQLIPVLDEWLKEIFKDKGGFYESCKKPDNGEGFGLVQAPRGALGHWVTVKNSKIDRYQIITPSAWNGSPRDSKNVRGPWEEALIGTRIRDKDNPVEVEHVIRSFDPCLVCTVHVIDVRKK